MKNLTAFQRAAIQLALEARTPRQRDRIMRARTHDDITFDAAGMMALDSLGMPYAVGRRMEFAYPTHDGRTADSTGAFLVGELERVDPTLHLPLSSVSWQRDINLRGDVTVADEFTSFTLSNFSSPGGLGAGAGIRNGKSWIGKATDQVGGQSVDIAKTPNPLTPWGQEVKFTLLELASAIRVGRPIDEQKISALRLKHQMDIDEQVYVGDATIAGGVGGLLNHPLMTEFSNVPNGAVASPLWANKTPQEILADVNALLNAVWANSAWAKMPNKLLLPPIPFGQLAQQVVSTAGSVSILKYLLENNVLTASTGEKLTIVPCKWCNGSGASGTIGTGSAGKDRMLAYRQETDLVRFPMTPLERTPIQYDAIYHKFMYYCRLGVVELVYPETIGARDGIS